MNNISESQSYTAIPPGETIREILKDRGITVDELANRTGISHKCISALLSGKCELYKPIAGKLETALGIGTDFWLNLEAIYRFELKKVKEENNQ